MRDLSGRSLMAAERIRQAVADLRVRIGSDFLTFTISIGVAEVGQDETGLRAAMARADQAPYRAKATGRNRVVAAASATAERVDRLPSLRAV